MTSAYFDATTGAIPLSGTITEIVNVANARQMALMIPVVTSGQLFLQAGATFSPGNDPLSADMLRVWDTASQGTFFANIAAGSLAMDITPFVQGFSHIRIELENAQAAARNITILTKT